MKSVRPKYVRTQTVEPLFCVVLFLPADDPSPASDDAPNASSSSSPSAAPSSPLNDSHHLLSLMPFALDHASLADAGSEDEYDDEDEDGDADMKDGATSSSSLSLRRTQTAPSAASASSSRHSSSSRSGRDAPLPAPLYKSDLRHVRYRYPSSTTKTALRTRAEKTKRLVDSLVRGIDRCSSEYRRLSSVLSSSETSEGEE